MSASVTFGERVIDGLRFGWRRTLPVVLQTEAVECGLASLTMVARYYGHDIDLAGLRRRASMSLKGANLARIIEIAGRLGFDSRPLRLELDELPQLKVPCILHWDLNHFVVLKQASAKGLVIHDPARGVQQLSLAEASKHFTGIALELTPAANFKPQRAREAISLRALTGEVHGLKRAMTQIFLLALGLEVVALMGPFYMQWVIDQVLVSADRSLLTLLGLGFLLLTVFQVAVTALRSWSITWISATLSVQWVGNLFGHLLRLPLDFFEKRHIGDVVSRFGSVQTIQRTLTTQFVGAVLDGLMSALTLVLMAFYSVPLTLLVVGAFLLYALLRWGIFGSLRRATEDHIVYAARQQSELLESIRGIQPLKLANQQDQRRGRYANVLVDTTNRELTIQRLGIAFQGGNGLIFGIERVAIIWLAALMVLRGAFSAGMLIAFVAYADQFTRRAAGLIDKWNDFRMLGLHAERVADIALTPAEASLEAGYTGPLPAACVEVKNLSFRYAEGEPWILKDCSLRIEAGECVAIAGPSGCGKTTLAKLLLGLLEPTEGTILFGGIDIRRLGLARYRSSVAAVMQDDQLFAGTIADNIAFFDPDATPLRVEAAARLAHIHDEIVAMPMGYQSLVGDMGSSLSGGQKQRVLLARALYRRPKLLVLDEATSHLDIERERQVNATVKRMKLTRLVIAHRPETLASADRVTVLQGGRARSVALRREAEGG